MGAQMRPRSMMMNVWLEGGMDFWMTSINIPTGKILGFKLMFLFKA